MQEIIRRCDFADAKAKVCGDVIVTNAPTEFTINKVTYEVDLCVKHEKEFEDCLAPFLTVAEPTKARNGKAVRKAIKGAQGSFTTKDVRKWLQDQGRDVSPTGRIPNSLIEEYSAAQAKMKTSAKV